MTQEVLEQANVIAKEIKSIEEHIASMQKVAKEKCVLSLKSDNYSDRDFWIAYMPTTLVTFVSMYIANAGARVIELKQQLANLK